MFTSEQLRTIYPYAPDDHIWEFSRQAEALFDRFEISLGPNRLAFFLAEIGEESAGLSRLEENLNYRPERLVAVWPHHFPTIAAAAPCAHDPEALANIVYASRMGNGGPETGDGWRYRGRGYIQLTGRANYAAVGAVAGLDLAAQPDLAMAPGSALLVACAYWSWRELNSLCDAGDFEAVTRRINGGVLGMASRNDWLARVGRFLTAVQPAA